MTHQGRMKTPLPPASQNRIATLTAKSRTRQKFSNMFSVHHAALVSTNRMKSIVIILFALLLFTASACTNVHVLVRQHQSSSGPTGINCKLKSDLKNQDQKTNVWCWAASAHTVIEYLKNEPLRQCDLLHALYRNKLQYEWDTWLIDHPAEEPPPPGCCMNMPEVEPKPAKKNVSIAQDICYQNGWPEHIFLTEDFRTHFDGYEYDWSIDYPHGLSWDEIVEEICADRPMISAILYAPELGGGAHTVVIGGYSELEDGSQWVHVYDPGFNTMEEDYYLWPYDVYLGDPGVFIHVRDYKNLSFQ
jgi:hypothetical protein